MTSTAYAYVRFSTADQAKGHSQERQIAACRAYCEKERLNLSPDVFFDEGVSAYKGKHLEEGGELRRFIDLVDSGEIAEGSLLLVENLDRLSRRHPDDAYVQLVELKRKGIIVVTLAPEQVYKKDGDESAALLAFLEMHRANSESSTKGERVKQAFDKKRKAAAETGKPMGDVAPGWLKLSQDGTRYELDPPRVKAVERIFELTIGGDGKNLIAKKLNAEGFPVLSKRESVKGWGTSAVHHVVKNRSVLGEWQPMTRKLDPKGKKRMKLGAAIPDYYPRIISEDTFDRAQKAIATRRKDKATKQGKRFNVWGKVAKCIHCGEAMHMVNKGTSKERASKGTTYIECSIGRKGLCESHKLIRLDQSEEIFALMLARLPLLELVKDSGAKLAVRLDSLEAKIFDKEKVYADRKAVFDVMPTVDVAASVERARTELADLQSQRDVVRADLAAENAIGFDTFMQRLDLVSDAGRKKANAVLKRLGVLVFVGREGFIVTMEGQVSRFGLAHRDGKAGYFDISGFYRQDAADLLHVAAQKAMKKAGGLYFTPPLDAGPLAYAREEEADQARYDALEDEGDHAPHHS
jgi:DNA invertase Pin-like site-specific DNA recombinase